MKKQKKKGKSFDLSAEEYKSNLVEARKQEMDFILPNYFTKFQGIVIRSGRDRA